MLYLKTDDTFTAWTGEAIDDVRYPLSIETMWSADELAAVGLFAPVVPDVPAGKEIVSTLVQMVEGVVTLVYELRDIPTAAYELSKRQISAALILAGVTTDPETWIRAVLNNIPDATQRALALNDWQNAPAYQRTNPLFNNPALMAAAGMTAAQIDAIWLLGKDQPA